MTSFTRSKSQALQSVDFAAKILSRVVVDHNAMGLEKAIQLVSCPKPEQPLQLGFGQMTALVFFQREEFKRASRQIGTRAEAPCEIVWDFNGQLHGKPFHSLA